MNHNPEPHSACSIHRRTFLSDMGMGFTGLALGAMLARDGVVRGDEATGWEPPVGKPHFAPKAKSVVWLFMNGGVSQAESFDPKPELTKYAGMSISETPFRDAQNPEKLKLARVTVINDANGQQRNKLYPLQVGYRKYGQSGISMSDLVPHLGRFVDDIAIIRSMYTTDDNHGAQTQFHSGRHMLDGEFPTLGAWVDYGLGSLNDNLPQFISMGNREYWNARDGHYLGPSHDATPIRVDPRTRSILANPPAIAASRKSESASTSSVDSTTSRRSNIRTIPHSRLVSKRMSSPIGCNRRYPKRSASIPSRRKPAISTVSMTPPLATSPCRC